MIKKISWIILFFLVGCATSEQTATTSSHTAQGAGSVASRETFSEGFARRGLFGQTSKLAGDTGETISNTANSVADSVPRAFHATGDSIKHGGSAVGRTVRKFFIGEEGMARVDGQAVSPNNTTTSRQPVTPVFSPSEQVNTNVVKE